MALIDKLKNIAENIRRYSTRTGLLTLDDIADGVVNVHDFGYEHGYSLGETTGYTNGHKAGVAEENARCVAKHFVTTVMGNGEASIRFHIPFEPDMLLVNCSDSDLYNSSTSFVANAYIDLSSFGMIGGVGQVGASGGFKNQAMTTTSVHNRYSRSEAGTVTLGNINSSVASVFKANRPYLVCAVKCWEQSDKERITEYVRSLEGGGSVTLNRAKVNAAFTDEEWAALIAEKPSYTFSFV